MKVKTIISPFAMLSEEESANEIKKIEIEKEAIRRRNNNEKGTSHVPVVVENVEAKRPVIVNKSNPFLNACKKTFNFIRDNLNVNLNVGGLHSGTPEGGVIANPLDKYSNFKPKVTVGISAGPLEFEVDSDMILKNMTKNGRITH